MDGFYDLKDREGLPDNLRVLLETFPRAAWQAHPHVSGLVAFWLERHALFRKLCTAMRADCAAEMDGALSPEAMKDRLTRFGGMLVQQLHAHHQIEDTHYFPRLRVREARLATGFDILDRDHHAMDGLLQRFAASANGVLRGQVEIGVLGENLAGFERLLLRHLEDEEDLIVPVILKHGPEGLQ